MSVLGPSASGAESLPVADFPTDPLSVFDAPLPVTRADPFQVTRADKWEAQACVTMSFADDPLSSQSLGAFTLLQQWMQRKGITCVELAREFVRLNGTLTCTAFSAQAPCDDARSPIKGYMDTYLGECARFLVCVMGPQLVVAGGEIISTVTLLCPLKLYLHVMRLPREANTLLI